MRGNAIKILLCFFTIDLRDITTTTDADADVDVLEDLIAEDEDRLEDLEAEDLGLDELDGAAVDADEALALLADGDCDRCSLYVEESELMNQAISVKWRVCEFTLRPKH